MLEHVLKEPGSDFFSYTMCKALYVCLSCIMIICDAATYAAGDGCRIEHSDYSASCPIKHSDYSTSCRIKHRDCSENCHIVYIAVSAVICGVSHVSLCCC